MYRSIPAAGFSLALALISSQAMGRSFEYPGAVCRPIPSSVSCTDYGQWGVGSTCPTAITVECPLPIVYSSSSPNVYQVFIVAYDRNTSANVECTLQKTDYSGSVLYSNSTSLKTTNSSSSAFFKYAFPNVPQGNGVWRLRCSLPGVQSGQYSHLTSIFVGTND